MGNKKTRKPRISMKLLSKRRLENTRQLRAAKAASSTPEGSINRNTVTQNIVATEPCCSQNIVDDFVCIEPQLSTTPTPGGCSTNTIAQSSAATEPSSFQNVDDLVIEPKLDKENKINIGRRIMNVSQFFNDLQEVASHGPLNCNLKSVEIISEKRTGLVSQFKLKCAMCNRIFFIHNDNPVDELDINTSAVAGTIAVGCGYSQLSELSAAIGLVPMSKNIFSSKMEIIHKKWENELLKSMTEAADEERELAIKDGRVNSSGTAIIDVIADGCYGKRSYRKNYSSLSGAAAIIGKRTNKILYLAIKNKYCCICALAHKRNQEAKEHACYKNFAGASTAMESEILVEGFKKSMEMHSLIYGRLISDGDANTYTKILQARPYENYTVEKVECRNHLLRNLCNKLCSLATDTKFLLKYRKYVTKKRVLSIRKVVTEAIKKYKDSRNITGLHQDIVTAPEHAFGRHSKCKEYFCSQKEDDKDIEQEMFSNSIWQRIKLIVTQLAAHARSLIVDVDSNSVERYHSIVAKFVGGKRINYSQRYQYQMRCNAAALAFNTERPLSALHKAVIGKSPHNPIKRHEEKKQKSRRLTQKYLRKKRRLYEKEDTRNYGEECSKPDIEPDMMLKSKTVLLNELERDTPERERIAKETVLQSGSSEWLELRRNLLTASNFGRVIQRRMDISCHNLVKDILYKTSIDHVKSIKHGRTSETKAITQLSKEMGLKIDPCGLYIDSEIPYLGATPDGIVDEDTIIEIKCPTTTYDVGVEKAIEEKKIPFYKKDKNGTIIINKRHSWYYQVQGQLHVTKRNRCIFGIWSGTDFPVKTEIIYKDDQFWSNCMEDKLKAFYLDCILPELVDPRFPRKMPIRDPIYITEAIKRKNEKKTKINPPTNPSPAVAEKRKASEQRTLQVKKRKLSKKKMPQKTTS